MKAALLFSLLCCTAGGAQPACSATPAAALLDVEMCWADYYARAYGVPLEFVQAVIDVESAWHPYVISTKGAAGLMQLTRADRVHLRRDQPFSDRRKHSRRGCIPCVFDSAVRRRTPACGSRLLCRRDSESRSEGSHALMRTSIATFAVVQRFYSKRQMVAKTTARYSTKGAEHQ